MDPWATHMDGSMVDSRVVHGPALEAPWATHGRRHGCEQWATHGPVLETHGRPMMGCWLEGSTCWATFFSYVTDEVAEQVDPPIHEKYVI